MVRRPLAHVHTHAHPRNVSVVIHQTPLMADDIKPKNVVVDFVRVLVEAAEGVDLVIPTVCHRGIDKARRTLAQSAGHFGPVSVRRGLLHRRAGHDVGIVSRRASGWGATRSEGHEGCGWACCCQCRRRCCWRLTAAKERLRGGGTRHRVGCDGMGCAERVDCSQ